jgi:4-amino-4-deoxy-L-arabinose transferase-like glycosyltransferase
MTAAGVTREPVSPAAGAAGRPWLGVVGLAVLAGWVAGLRTANPTLVDPDEPRSALVARLMVERGDWLAPHLPAEFHHDHPRYPVEGDLSAYWDKPPLYFWLVAAGMEVLGPTALAARLPSALSHVAAVLLVYAIGRFLWGLRAGLWAGVALAVAALPVIMSHVARMESLLAALTTLMLLAALRLMNDRPRSWLWTGVLYVAAGLGILTKGPAAAVLPAAAIAFTVVLSRRWADVGRLRPVSGLLILLAVAAPWFLYMHLRYPAGIGGTAGFAHEFFLSQNLARATTQEYGHQQVPGFLAVMALAGLLPWTIFLPGALGHLVPQGWRERRERSAVVLLLAWAAVVVGAFSLSRTQLPHYVAPAMPPLAVLVGAYLADRLAARYPDSLFVVGLWFTTVATAAGLVALVIALKTEHLWHSAHLAFVALMAGLTVAGAVAQVRRRPRVVVGLLVAGAVAIWTFFVTADPFNIYGSMTTRKEWSAMRHVRRPGDRVIAYPYTPYSLAWHMWPERVPWPSTRVNGEEKPSLPGLIADLNEPRRTFAVIQKKKTLDALEGNLRWPIRVVAQTPRHTLIVTEPPEPGGAP